MRITWSPTHDRAPEYSDDCTDCDQGMMTIMVGADRNPRCVPCHSKYRKASAK